MTCPFRSPGYMSEPQTCVFAWRAKNPWSSVCSEHAPQVLTCPVKIIAAGAPAAAVVLEVMK